MESKRNETFGNVIFSTNMIQETWSGHQETIKEATRQGGAPSTLMGPLLLHRPTSSSYISPHTPPNLQEHHENLIPLPQPSVPERSHLGAFSGAPPEGALIMEGLYINSMASPVMCEQFTSDLRVHSQQLYGFFSLFGSQYEVLPDSLGDLFDVTLFAVCLSRSDELWVYDPDYL